MKTRKIANILLAAAVVFCATACQSGFEQSKASKPRKIALHSYVYHKCATLEDVVEDAASMGVNGVVLSRRIKLGKYPDAKVGVDMTAEQKAYVKKLFAENKLEIASFGIGGDFINADEADKYFAFCKEMGIPILTWEGNYRNIPSLDKKAAKYGVKLAIHHHTKDYNKDNLYNVPEAMRARVNGFDNVFAIVDNGHWAREKTDAVRGYRTIGDKIIMLHFKDVAKFGAKEKTDVALGDGVLNLPELLRALDDIGFDGYFVLENETVFDNPTPAMRKSVKYLRNH